MGAVKESGHAKGRYTFTCYDKNGKLKWHEIIDNVICTAGKNELWSSGSGPTSGTAYFSLIGNTSFTGVSAGDTSAAHGGWSESSNFSGNRLSPSWGSPSAGGVSFASALSFSITGTDTIQGGALWFGSGASATVGNTSGFIWSAGTFGSGQAVSNGDTINVSYTTSI
jgi:hypothetical protein